MAVLTEKQEVKLFKENDGTFFVGEKIEKAGKVTCRCHGCNNEFVASVGNYELVDQMAKGCCFRSSGYHSQLSTLAVGLSRNIMV